MPPGIMLEGAFRLSQGIIFQLGLLQTREAVSLHAVQLVRISITAYGLQS